MIKIEKIFDLFLIKGLTKLENECIIKLWGTNILILFGLHSTFCPAVFLLHCHLVCFNCRAVIHAEFFRIACLRDSVPDACGKNSACVIVPTCHGWVPLMLHLSGVDIPDGLQFVLVYRPWLYDAAVIPLRIDWQLVWRVLSPVPLYLQPAFGNRWRKAGHFFRLKSEQIFENKFCSLCRICLRVCAWWRLFRRDAGEWRYHLAGVRLNSGISDDIRAQSSGDGTLNRKGWLFGIFVWQAGQAAENICCLFKGGISLSTLILNPFGKKCNPVLFDRTYI